MRIPPRVRSVGAFLVDVIELYLPMGAFFVLFVSFMTQIVCRYFFKPLIWPEELSLICFVWTALLGGLYAKRTGAHVAFGMVYDSARPGTRRYMRIAGNVIMLAAFVIAFLPSWSYIDFMSFKKSDALRIPMNIAYFPFMIFLADMIVRLVVDIVRDLRGMPERTTP